MALTNCPNCGKQISDKAEKCVHCGISFHQQNSNNADNIIIKPQIEKKRSSSGVIPLLIGLSILVTALAVMIYYSGMLDEFFPNQKGESQVKKPESEVKKVSSQVFETISNVQEEQPKVVDQTALKIVTNIYSWSEDENYAAISFQYEDDPRFGTMTLSGNIFALELIYEGDRNAIDAAVNPNGNCTFYYKYEIRGTYIHLTFNKSTCGYEATNKMLPYSESCNCITAYTGQGEMNFKPF